MHFSRSPVIAFAVTAITGRLRKRGLRLMRVVDSYPSISGIIDDDSRNIFALSALLKAKGYQVLSATGARAGISMMQNGEAGQVGIILLDMMMPDMDGYEAIPAIRAKKALEDIPIVAVTAQAMVGDREKCLEAGADDYVSKPINVDTLIEMLDKYLK